MDERLPTRLFICYPVGQHSDPTETMLHAEALVLICGDEVRQAGDLNVLKMLDLESLRVSWVDVPTHPLSVSLTYADGTRMHAVISKLSGQDNEGQLVALSRYPLFSSMHRALDAVVKATVRGVFETRTVIEAVVEAAVLDTLLRTPDKRRQSSDLRIGDTIDTNASAMPPRLVANSCCDEDCANALSRLSGKAIVWAWAALLLEARLVIRGKSHEYLAPLAAAIVSCIAPIPFVHVYAPVLPSRDAVQLLSAPVPFIVGVDAHDIDAWNDLRTEVDGEEVARSIDSTIRQGSDLESAIDGGQNWRAKTCTLMSLVEPDGHSEHRCQPQPGMRLLDDTPLGSVDFDDAMLDDGIVVVDVDCGETYLPLPLKKSLALLAKQHTWDQLSRTVGRALRDGGPHNACSLMQGLTRALLAPRARDGVIARPQISSPAGHLIWVLPTIKKRRTLSLSDISKEPTRRTRSQCHSLVDASKDTERDGAVQIRQIRNSALVWAEFDGVALWVYESASTPSLGAEENVSNADFGRLAYSSSFSEGEQRPALRDRDDNLAAGTSASTYPVLWLPIESLESVSPLDQRHFELTTTNDGLIWSVLPAESTKRRRRRFVFVAPDESASRLWASALETSVATARSLRHATINSNPSVATLRLEADETTKLRDAVVRTQGARSLFRKHCDSFPTVKPSSESKQVAKKSNSMPEHNQTGATYRLDNPRTCKAQEEQLHTTRRSVATTESDDGSRAEEEKDKAAFRRSSSESSHFLSRSHRSNSWASPPSVWRKTEKSPFSIFGKGMSRTRESDPPSECSSAVSRISEEETDQRVKSHLSHPINSQQCRVLHLALDAGNYAPNPVDSAASSSAEHSHSTELRESRTNISAALASEDVLPPYERPSIATSSDDAGNERESLRLISLFPVDDEAVVSSGALNVSALSSTDDENEDLPTQLAALLRKPIVGSWGTSDDSVDVPRTERPLGRQRASKTLLTISSPETTSSTCQDDRPPPLDSIESSLTQQDDEDSTGFEVESSTIENHHQVPLASLNENDNRPFQMAFPRRSLLRPNDIIVALLDRLIATIKLQISDRALSPGSDASSLHSTSPDKGRSFIRFNSADGTSDWTQTQSSPPGWSSSNSIYPDMAPISEFEPGTTGQPLRCGISAPSVQSGDSAVPLTVSSPYALDGQVEAVRASTGYKAFEEASALLCRLDIEALERIDDSDDFAADHDDGDDDAARVVFWLNLHNLAVIHGCLSHGPPPTSRGPSLVVRSGVHVHDFIVSVEFVKNCLRSATTHGLGRKSTPLVGMYFLYFRSSTQFSVHIARR